MNQHSRKFAFVLLPLVLAAMASCAILDIGSHAAKAVLSEPDPLLAKDALPAFIKVSESMMLTYPNNASFKTATASLYLLYATSFLEGEAWYLEASDYDAWMELKTRASGLYRRAFGLLSPLVEKKSPGFFSAGWSIGSQEADQAAKAFRKGDVSLMYYSAAAILAAFSSNPLDFEMSSRLPAALTLLKRALELDRFWGDGSLLELAFQVYAAMPDGMGISEENITTAYRDALLATKGLSASLHINYAMQYCLPREDRAGFLENLTRATTISQQQAPVRALMNALARRKALYLIDHVDEYIPEGGSE